MLLIKNDSERIKKELKDLKTVNEPLLMLLIDLYIWVFKKFNKDVVITMIYRTQEEQDSIYGNNIKYKQKPWRSPHQFHHACDIRSIIFTDKEIAEIEDYLNNKYNKSNYYKWTAKNHKVGKGAYHFHIQYYKL